METKKCPQCSEIKPIPDFGWVSRRHKTGVFVTVRSWCKDCMRIKSCEYARKKRSTKEGLDKFRLAQQRHREKIGTKARAIARTKEKIVFEGVTMTRGQRAEIKAQRRDQAVLEKQEKKRLAEEKRLAAKAERQKAMPWTAPGLNEAEKFRLRYALDSEFNIKERLRAAMRRKRQGARMGDLIRDALKRNGTTPKFEEFAGYTTSQLKVHLEAQFTKGMNWERFRLGEIHIDHIVPISSFNLGDPEELRRAWAITNLRPLWAKDNLKKSDKRIYLI